jgi:hypothetical protein
MGLADVERALVRLYTDAALRERFAQDPGRAAAELLAEADDQEYLCEVPPGDLESYARSLIAKRWGDVAKLVPLMCRAIGESMLRRAFEAYARTPAPGGTRPVMRDALAFAEHWRETPGPIEDWQLDVARYERTRLELLLRRAALRIARFRCDVRAFAADAGSAAPPTKRTAIVWLRTPSKLREWPA